MIIYTCNTMNIELFYIYRKKNQLVYLSEKYHTIIVYMLILYR